MSVTVVIAMSFNVEDKISLNVLQSVKNMDCLTLYGAKAIIMPHQII